MKDFLSKLILILFPWSYSRDRHTRVNRVTGEKQTAIIEDDWCGMPKAVGYEKDNFNIKP